MDEISKKGVDSRLKTIERAFRRGRDKALSLFGLSLHTRKSSIYTDRYHKRLGPFRFRVSKSDITLLSYEKDGVFDYEAYKEIQELANKEKIDNIFAKEENIAHMAAFLKSRLGEVRFGLCHGTRRGLEQAWFEAHLGPPADVLGTEISETATEFPKTIQWDFHDVKPEWRGACDFVYSNSWDHAFDPERAFTGWAQCLKPGGLILLEHTEFQSPHHVMPSDPFGTTRDGLIAFINEIGAKTQVRFETDTVIEDLPNQSRNDVVVVARRAA